jgi:TetR/AcrR family transcriptional regulator, regulator of cefoperazone and chloramphenicol sensitivity
MVEPTASAPPPRLETDDRLLQAAGEVFAEFGFRRATVRDICARAGANIAAVNYHFGDKAGLYAAVVKYGMTEAIQKYPPDMGLPKDQPASAEQRLRAFIRGFLFRVLEPGPGAWHGRLMMWEMVEPTNILGELFAPMIRPMYQRLTSIVTELLGRRPGPERVTLCCISVLGQCTFYRMGAPLLSQVQPDKVNPPTEQIEAIADHVSRVMLAALRDYAASPVEGTARS